MLKLFVSKSVGIFVVKTFTKNGTKITNYALLESKTCNKTIVRAEEIIFVNTLVPENCFFTTTTFCRKTGTKLVQKRYKNLVQKPQYQYQFPDSQPLRKVDPPPTEW